MRKHTDQYAWHRATLACERPPIHTTPEAGWFLYKSSDGFIPASIYLEQPIDPETGELIGDEIMRAEIGGAPCDPEEVWTWLAKRPITKAEYERLLASSFAEAPRANGKRALPF